MTPGIGLALTGAAMAAALAAGAVVYFRRWRRKSPDEIEHLRRFDLHRRGRITHGQVLDVLKSDPESDPRTTVVYSYTVAGVTYEVGQDVTALANVALAAHTLPGHDVSIKYDQRQPANSIMVCEEWSGTGKLVDWAKEK